MRLVKGIRILVLLGITWILDECRAEKDFNTCTFYYWKVDWHSAVNTCKRDNKQLLCYKSRKEVDDITEAFRLSAYNDAELDIWMSSKNCSSHSKVECLSLHIAKSNNRVWHFFQEECSGNFPFVCCVKDSDVTSTYHSTSSTTIKSTSSISDKTTKPPFTSTSQPKTCKGIRRRGILWPETNVHETAIQPCPGYSSGNASWPCNNVGNGRWADTGPNLKDCRSYDILNLKDKFNKSSIAEIMVLLENAFKDHEREVFGEDLADVISLMTSLPERLFLSTVSQPSSNRWNATKTYIDKSAALLDRMIELDSSWNDIDEQRRPGVGSDLLSTIDEMGLLLADAMTEDVDNENIIGDNMVLQVTKARHGESLQLPQGNDANRYTRQGKVFLGDGYDSNINPEMGNVSVVFTLYNDLRSVLFSQNQNSSSNTGALNSAVVSAIVSQNRKPRAISSKVEILVEHLTLQPNQTACTFWNMQLNQWDTSGCYLEESNDTFSLCICDHLTNFAVLMDYKGVLDDVDQTVFDYITLIGCSVSIICLALCVMIFSCYSYHSKHSWVLRYAIHRNLCLTLLIGNLVLVFGLDKTDNSNLCAVVAGALHYFFLSAFSWMLLEGVHIYLLLVVVFASRRSHWEKYYLFGYGFPMVIVVITAISRPMYYGTDEACWLSIEKGTIWAFMGPVGCILLVNTLALALAQWKASNVSVKNDNIAMIKRWLRVTFILFPVLGITWVFGFLYVGKHFEVAGYLFAIFNSLQGFCIFVCHCVMDKKARNMVLASFRRKTASVNTGSSGTQKNKQKDILVSNGTSNQNPLQNDSNTVDKNLPVSFLETCRLHWRQWPKPWSFCVDMPVSEHSGFDNQKMQESPKQAIMQWNSLRDKVT